MEPILPVQYPALKDVLADERFTSATPDRKEEVINNTFEAYEPLMVTDEDSLKMWDAKLKLRENIGKERLNRSIVEMLPQELQTEENANFLHRHILNYWNDSDGMNRTPRRVPPIRLTPIEDSELGQLTDKVLRKDPLPVLLPSEQAKLRAQLAQESELGGESPDFNPLKEAMLQEALKSSYNPEGDAEDLNKTLLSREDKESSEFDKRGIYGKDDVLEKAGKGVFDSLAKLRSINMEKGLSKWRDVTGGVHPDSKQVVLTDMPAGSGEESLFSMRKKPHPNKNLWEIRPGKGPPIEVPFDRDIDLASPEDRQFFNDEITKKLRENYDKFSNEDGSILTNSDRERVQMLFGVPNRGLLGESAAIYQRDLAPIIPATVAGVAAPVAWLESYVMPESFRPFGAITQVFSQMTDTMRKSVAPTFEDMQLENGWNFDGSQLASKTANFGAIIAQIAATKKAPTTGITLMSSQAAQGAFQEIYNAAAQNGVPEDEALKRAYFGASIEGTVNGTLTWLSGRALINNSFASQKIRDVVTKSLGDKSKLARWTTNFASALPGEVTTNVAAGALMRINSAIVHDIALDGVKDETLQPIRDLLGEDGMKELKKNLWTGLQDDVFFGTVAGAGIFGHINPRGLPADESNLIPIQQAKPLALGKGSIVFHPEGGMLHFDQPAEASRMADNINKLDDLTRLLTEPKEGGGHTFKEGVSKDTQAAYTDFANQLNRRIASQKAFQEGQVETETALSKHDTLEGAVKAAMELANTFVLGKDKSLSQQRGEMVEKLLTRKADTAKDWEKERAAFLANYKREFPSQSTDETAEIALQIAELEGQMGQMDQKSREFRKAQADYSTLIKLRERSKSQIRPTKDKDAEAAADEWVKSQKSNIRENFRMLAEKQADQVFGVDPTLVNDPEFAEFEELNARIANDTEQLLPDKDYQRHGDLYQRFGTTSEAPLTAEFDVNIRDGGDMVSALNKRFAIQMRESPVMGVPTRFYEVLFAPNKKAVSTGEAEASAENILANEKRLMNAAEELMKKSSGVREQTQKVLDSNATVQEKVAELEKLLTGEVWVKSNLGGEKSAKESAAAIDETHRTLSYAQQADLFRGSMLRSPTAADILDRLGDDPTILPSRNDVIQAIKEIDSELANAGNLPAPERTHLNSILRPMRAKLVPIRDKGKRKAPIEEVVETVATNQSTDAPPIVDAVVKQVSGEKGMKPDKVKAVVASIPEGEVSAKAQERSKTASRRKVSTDKVISDPTKVNVPFTLVTARGERAASTTDDGLVVVPGSEPSLTPEGAAANAKGGADAVVESLLGKGVEASLSRGKKIGEPTTQDVGGFVRTKQEYENGTLITSKSGNETWIPKKGKAEPAKAEAKAPEVKPTEAPKPEAVAKAVEPPAAKPEDPKPATPLGENERVVRIPIGSERAPDGKGLVETFRMGIMRGGKFNRWFDEPALVEAPASVKEGTENLAKKTDPAVEGDQSTDEAKWSDATKRAVAEQRGKKMPIGLNEERETGKYTLADRIAIAKDLDADTHDPVRLALLLKNKFAPGKGVAARTGSEGAEAEAEVKSKKIEELPDGTSKHDVDGEVVFHKDPDPTPEQLAEAKKAAKESKAEAKRKAEADQRAIDDATNDVIEMINNLESKGKLIAKLRDLNKRGMVSDGDLAEAERIKKDRDMGPEDVFDAVTILAPKSSKTLNPKAGKSTRSKKGETIIFSELADFLTNGIKSGWNAAKAIGEAMKKFGENFKAAIVDTWKHVTGSMAESVADHPSIVKFENPHKAEVDAESSNFAKNFPQLADTLAQAAASEAQARHNINVRDQDNNRARTGQSTDAERATLVEDVKRIYGNLLVDDRVGMNIGMRGTRPLWKALRDIHPDIGNAQNNMEFFLLQTLKDFGERVDGLSKQLKKLSGSEKRDFQFLAGNGDFQGVRQRFARNQALLDQFNDWVIHSKYIEEVAARNGLPIGHQKNYWARKVKDYHGLKEWIAGSQYKSVIDAEIAKEEKKLGYKITDPRRLAEISGKVVGNTFSARTTGTSTKTRKIEVLPPEMMKFYESDPHQVLHDYVTRMATDIANARYLGIDAMTQAKSNPNEQLKPLPPESVVGNVLRDLVRRGQITSSQELHAMHLIQERMNFRKSHYITKAMGMGNMPLAMNNPINNLSQLQSFAITAWRDGALFTGKGAVGKGISMEDVGLRNNLDLFTGETLMKGLSEWVAKWSGFKLLDAFEGNTSMNSWLKKMQSMDDNARNAALAPLQRFIENGNVAALSRKIKDGNLQDQDVKFAVFNAMSDVRPTSISSMPLSYIRHPVLRLVYNLRTYAIHQMDYLRDQAHTEGKKNPLLGIKALTTLGGALVVSGATIDEARDYMLGRSIDLKSHIYNNLFKLAVFSKYQATQLNDGLWTDFLSGYINSPTVGFLEKVWRAGSKVKEDTSLGLPWYEDLKENRLMELLPTGPIPALKLHYWWNTEDAREKKLDFFRNDYSGTVSQLTERYNLLERTGKDKRKQGGTDAEYKTLGKFNAIKTKVETLMKYALEDNDLSGAAELKAGLDRVAENPTKWREEEFFYSKELHRVEYFRRKAGKK